MKICVAYSHKYGKGRCTLIREGAIEDEKDFREIEQFIEKEFNSKEVVIDNIMKLPIK